MVEVPMKNCLKEHFFYKEKSIDVKKDLKDAKQEMNRQLYEMFCDEVNKILQKWAALYEAALASPEAFIKLDTQCNTRMRFKQLEKNVNSGCADELTRKYVEAKQFMMHSDEWYPNKCKFAIRIQILVIDIAVFLDKAVAKKIHLKEINEKWNKTYPEEGQLDEIEEPPRKRLKRTEQNEETISDKQEESVSCRFSSR
jgi:hypothetical protein